MKADNKTTGHSRTILVTEIQDPYGQCTELEITIGYTGHGSAVKGSILDGIIVPAIVTALNRNPPATRGQRGG